MLMNVLVMLITVTTMQLATTHMETTPALAPMDTQAMGFLAQVSYTLKHFIMKIKIAD